MSVVPEAVDIGDDKKRTASVEADAVLMDGIK